MRKRRKHAKRVHRKRRGHYVFTAARRRALAHARAVRRHRR